MAHDYRTEMKSCITDWLLENYTEKLLEELKNFGKVTDHTKDELYDDAWVADDVTGNGIGSFYCDSGKSLEALSGNFDLLYEALQEFGMPNIRLSDLKEKDEEWADVTIRCYLLNEVFWSTIDEVEKKLYEEHKDDIEEDEDDEEDTL